MMGILPRSPSPGRPMPNDAVQKDVQDLRVSSIPGAQIPSVHLYIEKNPTQPIPQARLALLERGYSNWGVVVDRSI